MLLLLPQLLEFLVLVGGCLGLGGMLYFILMIACISLGRCMLTFVVRTYTGPRTNTILIDVREGDSDEGVDNFIPT